MGIGKIRIITVLIALSSCALLAEMVEDADSNERGSGGKTELHRPFLCDGKARALAEAGGDVNAVCDSGFTPLMYAVSRRGYGQSQCVYSHVEDLLELGADPLLKTPDGRNLLIVYIDDFKSAYYHRHHRNLGPPNPETAKLLLDAGINPLERDSSGRSALSLALRIAGKHSDVKRLHEVVAAAAVDAAGNEADAVKELILEEKRLAAAERPPREPGEYLFFLPAALILCYVGFSVAAREHIYRGRHKDNWVGSVNGFVAGFALGAYAAGLLLNLIGLKYYDAYTLLTAAAGLAAGWWMSGKRETFNKYASMYYGLPLFLAIPVWGITLFFTL
ncbi:MAG: hypothetical protein FWB94_11840 [Chitinispirillia bacterium]|nr:hypothetical protein [Chitinispirillia bacterium]